MLKGFKKLYLSTDHIGYYEKSNFNHIANSYYVGEKCQGYTSASYSKIEKYLFMIIVILL